MSPYSFVPWEITLQFLLISARGIELLECEVTLAGIFGKLAAVSSEIGFLSLEYSTNEAEQIKLY